MRLQSWGPGREQRMCSGCGSKARGEVRVVGRGQVEPTLLSVRKKKEKKRKDNRPFLAAQYSDGIHFFPLKIKFLHPDEVT